MKNNSFVRFLVAGAMALTSQVYAQAPAIDSLKLIPANPTSNDALQVVCYTTFPYGGCEVNNIHSEQQGNDILLILDYNMGMAAYICHSVDTISIENPGAGDFRLITYITTNGNDVMQDTDTLEFHIDPYLGLPEYETTHFLVCPNPFGDELRLKTNFTIEKLEIYTVSGQKMELKEAPSSAFGNTDVSHLKKGIYLITVTDKSGNRFMQRAVKN